MHLMICSQPTPLAGIVLHHAFDENCSNGGRAEPTKEAFVGISFVAERPTELL